MGLYSFSMDLLIAVSGYLAVATITGLATHLYLSRTAPPPKRTLQGPFVDPAAFQELVLKVEALERRWNGLLEELDDRIDRGNKAWRRIRAKERRQEVAEEEEDWDDDVPRGDARGGNGQGVLPLPNGVEARPSGNAAWEDARRALNRRIAGIE